MTQIKLIRGSALQRKLSVVIGAERIDKRYQQEIAKTGKRMRLPGFRPGQVPGDVVEQQHGEQIREQIVSELVQDALFEAISEKDLRLAAAPVVDSPVTRKDGGVEFVAEFEIMPEIEFSEKQIAKLKLTRYSEAVSDADVDAALQRLLDSNPDWSEVEEPAQYENRLVCDFRGRVDGEPFPGSDASDYGFILGRGEAIPGFEEQILGLRAGEEKTFDLDAPEDHPREEIRGRRVSFEVKVVRVERSSPAELNDEFAARMTPPSADGAEGGEGEKPYDVQTLRERVREHLQGELREVLDNRTRRDLLETLGGAAKFAVPEAMIQERIEKRSGEAGPGAGDAADTGAAAGDGDAAQNREAQADADKQAEGKPAEPVAEPKLTRAERKAQRQQEKRQREEVVAELRSAFLLSHIAQQFEVKAEAGEVRAEIERRVRLIGAQQDPEKLIGMFYQNEELLRSVESNVRESNAVALVLDKANAQARSLGYDEALELFREESEADE